MKPILIVVGIVAVFTFINAYFFDKMPYRKVPNSPSKNKNMEKELRRQHLEFIEKDTEERGETIVSDICFFAAIYQCEIKDKGSDKKKSVMYSAADSVLEGYREIK